MQNFKNNLKKYLTIKNISIFSVILVVLLSGGLFFLKREKEVKGNVEDYEIKDTVDGKFIENKRAGLLMRVPEDWEAEKVDVGEGSILLQSLDIEGENLNGLIIPPLMSGCGIESTITYKPLSFEEIKKDVQEVHWALATINEEFEEIIINGKNVLKNTWESETRGSVITVFIPANNKVYAFSLAFASNEKDKCVQDFDSFLETVSIQ